MLALTRRSVKRRLRNYDGRVSSPALVHACIAGLLYDWTQHYPNSFYLGGAVTVAGALVLVPTAVRFRGDHTEQKGDHGTAGGEGTEEVEGQRGGALTGGDQVDRESRGTLITLVEEGTASVESDPNPGGDKRTTEPGLGTCFIERF